MKNFNQLKSRGFTLIELLVTISIIGVLMAIVFFGLQGARENARDTGRKADLETIKAGLELYRSDCNIYPVAPFPRTYTAYSSWPVNLVGGGSPAACAATNTYMITPKDRIDPTRYYRYYSLNGTAYEVCTSLEGGGVAVTCGGSNVCGASATCNYKVSVP